MSPDVRCLEWRKSIRDTVVMHQIPNFQSFIGNRNRLQNPSPMKTASPENFDHKGFWHCVRTTLAKCPSLDQIVAIYLAFTDSATPRWAKAVLVGALLYCVMPLDAIPDLIPVTGLADDIACVASILVSAAGAHVTMHHRKRARAILGLS